MLVKAQDYKNREDAALNLSFSLRPPSPPLHSPRPYLRRLVVDVVSCPSSEQSTNKELVAVEH